MSAFRNRLYYGFKPLIPASARYVARKWFARRQLRDAGDTWPILPGSEQPPQGWTGWPHGKKFAFVLTHDVESPDGLAKCRQLMELEMKWGFRSSFNFIPEGDYQVSRELRERLTGNGFETGIHDLHHDGRLYRNRRDFNQKAIQINQHLKHWNAVGFRSGFMLHNLDWLHELDIQYDASTFDTDPFEPQPDNLGTIFPFWVPGVRGKGYLELPYTLPQDSTLFLLLGETSPNIWMQKLDWIAQHGGMALIDVHPDYLRFAGDPVSTRNYPAAYYESFLQYVTERYAGAYWHVLPKDLAAWHRNNNGLVAERLGQGCAAADQLFMPALPATQPLKPERAAALEVCNKPRRDLEEARLTGVAQKPLEKKTEAPSSPPRDRPRRVCMVAYSNYETDNRVMRYAEELAKRGDHVEVLALKGDKTQPRFETIDGVHVCRVQRRYRKKEQNRISYVFPLIQFFLLCSARLSWRHIKKSYDLIHVHNMPDFLVFTAWLPKLAGCKIILDIHDIVPEFYASKFDISSNARGVEILKNLERASARFSNHVIVSNHLWLDTFAARNSARDKCSVFINNVNSSVFWPHHQRRNDGKFVILFPGGLQWHQGLDIALRAFQKITNQAPHAEFHIYGDGHMKQSLIDLAHELGMDGKVRFFDPLSVRQIAKVMANADLGVVPKRADSFGDKAYSTKIMEFMAVGVPVIVSSTTIDRYYFDDSVVRFFPSGDSDALAEAMLEMISDPNLRRQMAARASEYAVRNSWETRKEDYLHLVDSLCDSKERNGHGTPS
jgi:glycosyltransferase involved in cell wall biosynthesis